MIAIKNNEGLVIRDKEGIVSTICEYYKQLYSDSDYNNTYLDKVEDAGEDHHYLDILEEEIEYVVKKLKDGKSPGVDGVTNEEIKAGGHTLITLLAKLFNNCLKNGTIPQTWLKAKLILLFKKGDRQDIKNYRPINILSVIYKIFMSVITRRIDSRIASTSPNQTGFKKDYSTLDNILTIQQLIRRAHEYNLPIVLIFIDFEKAFDSVKIKSIINTLETLGIGKPYLDIFKYIYKHATLNFGLENTSQEITLKRGLRQGDVPSAKLFNIILELAMSNLEWEKKGININGSWLNMLKFADDVVLIGKCKDEVQNMLKEVIIESGNIGLKINFKKTRCMFINCEETVLKVGEDKIESVNNFIYLGVNINNEDDSHKEISRRMCIGWRQFNKYKLMFKSNVDMEYKRKLFNTCILPVMLYGCECWTLTEKNLRKVRTTVRSMARCMIGITKRHKKTKQWIARKAQLEDIGRIIIDRKWNWAGHIIRTRDDRWTKKMIEWYPRTGKRNRGRPKIGWEEEFKKCCGGVTWPRVAHERPEWNRLKEAYKENWLYKD